jgi:hypothetical protein
MKAARFRAYDDDGTKVVASGKVNAAGEAKFSSKERVGKVIFYGGKEDEEVVLGSVEVDKAGQITAAIEE